MSDTSRHPKATQMLGLYNQCRNLQTLPEAGGLLDQSAEHIAYFDIFASAEADFYRE